MYAGSAKKHYYTQRLKATMPSKYEMLCPNCGTWISTEDENCLLADGSPNVTVVCFRCEHIVAVVREVELEPAFLPHPHD